MTQVLTKSRLSAFRACQRLHHIQYEMGYRPVKEAGALRFGTLIHAGLECIWNGGEYTASGDADPWDMAKARPMLLGYVARWDRSLYEVLGVEEEFRAPLMDGWDIAGKFDAVVREKSTGRVLVCEHKTSSQDISPGGIYWQRLRLDSQLSIYWHGAKSKGYDVQGVIYDVLKKPLLRPKKNETPEQFEARVTEWVAPENYQRGEVVRLESEMISALADVKAYAGDIDTSGGQKNPDACERWGRMCDFFPVCCGEETLDNEHLYKLNVDVHPELSGSSKEESPHGTNEASSIPAPA